MADPDVRVDPAALRAAAAELAAVGEQLGTAARDAATAVAPDAARAPGFVSEAASAGLAAAVLDGLGAAEADARDQAGAMRAAADAWAAVEDAVATSLRSG